MNACDDGDEPVGEAPEVTMPQVVDAITRQAQIISEITALHQHMYDGTSPDAWQYCEHCKTTWPCDTMRIVERVAL